MLEPRTLHESRVTGRKLFYVKGKLSWYWEY